MHRTKPKRISLRHFPPAFAVWQMPRVGTRNVSALVASRSGHNGVLDQPARSCHHLRNGTQGPPENPGPDLSHLGRRAD
jgi:hypothetical protein